MVERRLLLYIPFSTCRVCRVCRVCRICRICREVCLSVHVEPTAAYRAYSRHDSTVQAVLILALVRTDLSDVIMDIRTRLDRILQQTAVTNPCHMENGVGPTAQHQRCTRFLVSLCYTVIALLLLLLLVAENIGKILLLLNNKPTDSTVEVFFSNVTNQATPVALTVYN